MLPLPLLLLIALLVGAVGFRLRGDAAFQEWAGRGAPLARLVCWSVPMGVLAWVAGHEPLTAGLIGLGLFLGCLLPWWSSLTLGRNPADGSAPGQYLRHGVRGVFWTLPAAILVGADAAGLPFFIGLDAWAALLASGAPILLASGLACVPAYELGWRLRPPGHPGPLGATEIGELAFGAAMAVAVVLSA